MDHNERSGRGSSQFVSWPQPIPQSYYLYNRGNKQATYNFIDMNSIPLVYKRFWRRLYSVCQRITAMSKGINQSILNAP